MCSVQFVLRPSSKIFFWLKKKVGGVLYAPPYQTDAKPKYANKCPILKNMLEF